MNAADPGSLPAFPTVVQWDGAGNTTGAQTGPASGHETGMSLRAYLAGRALTGMLAHSGSGGTHFADIAKLAVQAADHLLAELAKDPA